MATLYVVATPIGNREDLSSRAQQVLSEVSLIACEDTRHSRHFLSSFGVDTELVSYHEHNEDQVSARLLTRLSAGETVALISDAGTPLISDPGFVLIRAARAQGIRVEPIPGPCAAICALSAAGLPSDRFLFVGFPPRSRSQRVTWSQGFVNEPGTLICYESGRRVVGTLDDLAEVLGAERRAVIARELTKRFETFLVGTLSDLSVQVATSPEQQLGELVLLIEGDRRNDDEREQAEQLRVLELLAAELPLKQAAALAAAITGGARNRLYKAALAARDRPDDSSIG
ncbi:16S rRNA (cytidine(1402)-2'-O)-methyltransferase [Halochromatium sp.]